MSRPASYHATEHDHGPETIRKIVTIIFMFILINAVMLGMVYLSGSISEGVRSYVRGEGLWAKAQKDAVHHLLEYTQGLDEAQYDQFLDHIAVIEGDSRARMALDQSTPDLEAAREGFLAGENHPDDVDYLINFYLYFQDFYYMREAIEIWKEADAKIAEMKALGGEFKSVFKQTPLDFVKLDALHARLDTLNEDLHALENRFSEVLGQGARWVRNVTLLASAVILLVFIAIGATISTRIIRGLSRDMAERHAMQIEIHRQAREDPLTGLSNRNEFYERLGVHLRLAGREQKLLALLYLDLDKFKPVNDTYGHVVGDALLQSVAAVLLKNTRETDVVARMGGDEFAVLLVHPDDRRVVGTTAERIIRGISAPLSVMDIDITIGASIGISLYPDDDANGEDLVHKADTALYAAKHNGRNTHRFFDPEMSVEARANGSDQA